MLHHLLLAGLRFSKCSVLVSCTALKPSCSVLDIGLKQLVRQSLFEMMIFRQAIKQFSIHHMKKMAAVHFATIPCEPNTDYDIKKVNFYDIASELRSKNIVSTRFEDFITFPYVFMNAIKVSLR